MDEDQRTASWVKLAADNIVTIDKLEQQLADKKRAANTLARKLVEFNAKLKAAEAVVEAIEEFWAMGDTTHTRFLNIVVPKLNKCRKLQGGDGDE